MKTNKCLYLTFQPIAKADGVSKKVFAQKDALNKLQIETSILYSRVNEKHEYSFYFDNNVFIKNIKRKRLLSPFIYSTSFFNKIYNLIIKEKITLLYIRYGLTASPSFLNFLKKCKSNNIIIFIEIATYPYDGELTSFRLLPGKLIEQFYRKKLHKCVDRIVTYTDNKIIYNIKTINISNAASTNLLLKKNNIIENNELHLILVANIAFWHGIDRIIEGLKVFYEKKYQFKVYLNIIGEVTNNDEAQKLILLVNKYNLNNYIHFCGPKDGHELDLLFDKANLAIGCLGCHRKNITKVKSLKNIEYAMRGIPFIYSEINEDFDKMNYVHKISTNDNPIEIFELIEFIQKKDYIPNEIRKTVQHLTWEHQMNIIIKEYLNIKKDKRF